MTKKEVDRHVLYNLLDQTSHLNSRTAKQNFRNFQADTDRRIDRVIFKVEKLYNLGNQLNAIDNASKRAYRFANVKRSSTVEDQHVFAKMKEELTANVARAKAKDAASAKVSKYVDPNNKAYQRLKQTVLKTLC